MKYMLLIYGAENCWTQAERQECMLESMGICDQLAALGKYILTPLRNLSATANAGVACASSPSTK